MKKAMTQQELIRAVRARHDYTNAELAERIGKKVGKNKAAGISAWMAPASAARHRKMPASSRMLLETFLAQPVAKKK